MATQALPKEDTTHLAYFLAGHVAPAGVYREEQTGRELRLEEAGILPATCDGHVAVYLRQPLTWSERRCHNKVCAGVSLPSVCDRHG